MNITRIGICSWKMQYQTPELKKNIRNITNEIVGASTTIQNTIDLYVKSNVEIEKVKNGNSTNKRNLENYTKVRDKSTEFMMKKIDNRILNFLKGIQQDYLLQVRAEENRAYTQKYMKWKIGQIINYRLNRLFFAINQDLKNENKINNGYNTRNYILNKTKRAIREEALRNRDVGLIDWQEK